MCLKLSEYDNSSKFQLISSILCLPDSIGPAQNTQHIKSFVIFKKSEKFSCNIIQFLFIIKKTNRKLTCFEIPNYCADSTTKLYQAFILRKPFCNFYLKIILKRYEILVWNFGRFWEMISLFWFLVFKNENWQPKRHKVFSWDFLLFYWATNWMNSKLWGADISGRPGFKLRQDSWQE